MASFWFRLQTYYRLGLLNLIRVLVYRLQLRMGWFVKRLPLNPLPQGPFFAPRKVGFSHTNKSADIDLLEQFRQGRIRLYSNKWVTVGSPPIWHSNPVNGETFDAEAHWTRIADFGQGDIKTIWEASRFHWLTILAHQSRAEGGEGALRLLDDWLEDWVAKNPANQGPNWKCGQETSIRVINLILAAYLLNEHHSPLAALKELVRVHCRRVVASLHYAIAQDNNHGTSEVAALFIAGAWLVAAEGGDSEARRWRDRGRQGLEERVSRLIAEDGTFSQYSINYHRLMLDSLSVVEFFRHLFGEPEFSKRYRSRALAATLWLYEFTDPDTGEAPNLGANDGALLLQFGNENYRDFRPSVQFAAAMFHEKQAFRAEAANRWLTILGILQPDLQPLADQKELRIFTDGGMASLRREGIHTIFRFPRFRFRPSHADLLHVEVSDNGQAVLRDGGTFSYNTDAAQMYYFNGVRSHNTIEFDDGEPMPRLGRFLFGAWPRAILEQETGAEGVSVSARYQDYRGCSHQRQLSQRGRMLSVKDKISGFERSATLRWRLQPGEWQLTDVGVVGRSCSLTIEAIDTEIERIELVTGFESRHYAEITELPVLEVSVSLPGTLHTHILFQDHPV